MYDYPTQESNHIAAVKAQTDAQAEQVKELHDGLVNLATELRAGIGDIAKELRESIRQVYAKLDEKNWPITGTSLTRSEWRHSCSCHSFTGYSGVNERVSHKRSESIRDVATLSQQALLCSDDIFAMFPGAL